MIIEILHMDGYGLYVWSSFSFTLTSFFILYVVIKKQFVKERDKFVTKYGALDSKKA